MGTPVEDWIAGEALAKTAKRYGWTIEPFGDRAGLFRIGLTARDGALYYVKLDWTGCPAPPSAYFCDALRDIQVRSAWPTGNQAFLDYVKPPPDCFICCPLTKEGMEHHAEWLSTSEAANWKAGIFTAENTLTFLDALLKGLDYTGRLA